MGYRRSAAKRIWSHDAPHRQRPPPPRRLATKLAVRLRPRRPALFRLTGRRQGRRGSILNQFFGLTGRCGGGSRAALHALADCLSSLCHARLQRGLFHHLPPSDIVLPRERLTLRSSGGDQPVAYLNSGSILSPSLVPPGSVTLLPA